MTLMKHNIILKVFLQNNLEGVGLRLETFAWYLITNN